MKTKLIKIHGCKTTKEVLLFTQLNDKGDIEVVIQAWHDNKELENYEQYEAMKFSSFLMASRFVCDFAEISANEFANSFTF